MKETEIQVPSLDDVKAFYKAWIKTMHTRQLNGEPIYKATNRLKKVVTTNDYGYCCLGVGLKVGVTCFPQFLDTALALEHLDTHTTWEFSDQISRLAGSSFRFGANKEYPMRKWSSALNELMHKNDTIDTAPRGKWPIYDIISNFAPLEIQEELIEYLQELRCPQPKEAAPVQEDKSLNRWQRFRLRSRRLWRRILQIKE
jgi:hypothetical protein